MNHETVNKLNIIKSEINNKILSLNFNNYTPNIIAVTKTFSLDKIEPLIKEGHIHFGENKVQEALNKWQAIKEKKENLKLHMIGKLQSNKVKFTVGFFDYLHSVDSLRLAEKIANEQQKKKLKPKIFLQVNIGGEDQKSGVFIDNLIELYNRSVKDFNLNVIGLMCLPPENNDPREYFSKTKKLNDELKLEQLSMGMSNDYLKALEYKSTYLRIGSKIFGSRN
tara:strand:- start:1434 stop:2102 length:669 start_codon:yes stop_codon:yes gene_type:complete